MKLATHISGGVLGYGLAVVLFEQPYSATGVVLAASAAALPDIDTLGSTVGRVCAPLARRIEKRFGHRTATHAYVAQAAVAGLAAPLALTGHGGLYLAVVVGYASHPFLDTWTVQGVRLFWPFSDHRCVFPYYPRAETRYRTRTGSRADTLFGAVFFLAACAIALVHVDGYQRLVRKIQADADSAVRDFLDMSATHLVWVDVEAHDPTFARTLEGRFLAVGTPSPGTLLVRDPATGRVYSLGDAYRADFRPTRAVCHRGPAVTVSRRTVDLAGRVLADLENVLPRTPAGAFHRHVLDGTLRLTEPAEVRPDAFAYPTVEASGTALTLSFATLADLERSGLDGALVEAGALTVRVYVPTGQDEGYLAAQHLRSGRVRHVAFTFQRAHRPRLLVEPGQTVALGDTLAVMKAAEVAQARADVYDAEAALADANATSLPESAAVLTAQNGLRTAQTRLAHVRARHTAGFAPDHALQRAAADVTSAQTALTSAEHVAAEAQSRHAARVRAAQAALRRARLRFDQASAGAYVTTPTAGLVRQIDRHPRTPDREEIRIVLVQGLGPETQAPRPAPTRPQTPDPRPQTKKTQTQKPRAPPKHDLPPPP